jgi:uncharacterized protein (TIGR04255 family)
MKPTVQHLSKAPIVEAIIAFALEKPLTDSDAVFEQFYALIQSDYPSRNPVKMAQLTVSDQGSSGETQIVGARFASADGKRVCLVDQSNFICSRLAPYETWESLKSEFERLWKIYSPLCNSRIARVGVRYINKIFLPEGEDMSLTVRTRPEIAEGLPQSMFNFLVRLGVKIPDPQGVLMITEAQLPTERPGFVTAVLDHDLQFRINPESTDVWSLLDKARELKNDYFFASLSEDVIKEYL